MAKEQQQQQQQKQRQQLNALCFKRVPMTILVTMIMMTMMVMVRMSLLSFGVKRSVKNSAVPEKRHVNGDCHAASKPTQENLWKLTNVLHQMRTCEKQNKKNNISTDGGKAELNNNLAFYKRHQSSLSLLSTSTDQWLMMMMIHDILASRQ
ncbi:hypothetical protein T09_11795 [Trichinella sp. T9]|nr:hypothetical protein T09_11795 [Trichinella sp. T9]